MLTARHFPDVHHNLGIIDSLTYSNLINYQHSSALRYSKDGVEHMRMKFYLRGNIRNGTAEVDVRKVIF